MHPGRISNDCQKRTGGSCNSARSNLRLMNTAHTSNYFESTAEFIKFKLAFLRWLYMLFSRLFPSSSYTTSIIAHMKTTRFHNIIKLNPNSTYYYQRRFLGVEVQTVAMERNTLHMAPFHNPANTDVHPYTLLLFTGRCSGLVRTSLDAML